ncbi:hypothetical protein TD95_003845 [Thielaviopsis punctulata]|uniref:RING-type domain-containing protein n=1 Tax=Thielaviopsis punctulata TaxID=72032 RepID=A0A0F4Z722_9PEZI|nr:hypothetical protein TD95_003845 [Thielaviopsis punctulata]
MKSAPCCQTPIDYGPENPFSNKIFWETYEKKAREYADQDRIYCHSSACGRHIIGPHYLAEGFAHCVCRRRMCIACKQRHHFGRCHEDRETIMFRRNAQTLKVRPCPSCRHMIEIEGQCSEQGKGASFLLFPE